MSQSIKLTLRQVSDKEAIVILNSAQGQADHQFTLPWLDDQEWNAVFLYLKAFRQYPETWPQGAVIETAAKPQLATEDGTPAPQRIERIGRSLYQAIFGDGECERLFQRAFHSYQDSPPIIELHFPDAGSYLQTYPWEVLHDGDDFLFDSLRASLVRYVDFGKPLPTLKLTDKLNVLLVDPRPQMPDDYSELPILDRTALTDMLTEASHQILVRELDSASASASTLTQLAQALNQFYRNIHVVHLDAHSEYGLLCDRCDQLSSPGTNTCQHCGRTFFSEQKAQGYVAFAKTDGNLQWISGQKLGKALINRDIQLVVLSVCNSGLGGEGSAFNSVAGALVRQGIPAVVAMQFPVEALSTKAFVTSFYQTLLNNAPLTQAIAAAKTSLLDVEDAWYRPVLYLRTDPVNMEGRVFEAATSPIQEPTVPVPTEYPHQQPTTGSQIPPKINLGSIRRQLNQMFDDAELDSFCMDYFPEVYDKFSRGMRKDEKITLLLDYCRRVTDRYQKLLALLEDQS